MKKYLYLFIFFFSHCSLTAEDKSELRQELVGTYFITLAAQEFFVREKIPASLNQEISINAETTVSLNSSTGSQIVFEFVSIPEKDHVVFRLAGSVDKFLVMKLVGNLLTSTTNTRPSEEEIVFEWFAPFADRKNT